jgi:hypothetical protein
MTNDQTEELIKELKRLNDILLTWVQLQGVQVAAGLRKERRKLDGIQELPKIRKPTS